MGAGQVFTDSGSTSNTIGEAISASGLYAVDLPGSRTLRVAGGHPQISPKTRRNIGGVTEFALLVPMSCSRIAASNVSPPSSPFRIRERTIGVEF
jgi:hypothetical protein